MTSRINHLDAAEPPVLGGRYRGVLTDVTRYCETLEMLERGATPREVADAAAALAAPPNEKQGKLF